MKNAWGHDFGNRRIILWPIYLTLVLVLLKIFGCGHRSGNQDYKTGSTIVSDSLRWSVRMAESEIYRRDNSLAYDENNPKAGLNYQTGLFLKSLLDLWQTTADPRYFEYVKSVVDSYVMEDGTIKAYRPEEYNIDNINPGRVLLTLYRVIKVEKYKQAAYLLRKQLNGQPRTKSGNFWHKKIYPWQVWLDGIYMGDPFYVEFSEMFNQPEGFDDVINQILTIDIHTRDPKTGLRYHGWDESIAQKWANPENGCSANFWGRAVGWYAMALVDILDSLPPEARRRQQVVYILNDLLKAVVACQDGKSGLWFQVLDRGNRAGNYLEASASAMFVYTLAKSVHMSYVDSSYWSAATRGYQGLLRNLVVVEANGLVDLTQICAVAGLGGDPYRDGSYEYYISEPVVTNDLKGVGPFILASLQMEKSTEEK